MKYSHPQIRHLARRIPILCALYFVVFCFCFLYYFQRDILAQAQFLYSGGTTVYHPLLSAIICTLILAITGYMINRFFPWLSLRLKAAVWFLPFLLLGALSHWHFPELDNTSRTPGWPTYLLFFFIYGGFLLISRRYVDSVKERQTFAAYVWPNLLLLLLFTFMTIGLSNTSDLQHRTLSAARYCKEGDYDKILRCAQWERHPSRQLSVLTAFALSETGQLGDKLFNFPQPYGSEGLLPLMGDTSLFVNLPLIVGQHLGYKKSDRTPTIFFLQIADTLPKSHITVRDYMLCAYLLDRKLENFTLQLLHNDSLSITLPLHYREALQLSQYLNPKEESLLEDEETASRLQDFMNIINSTGTKEEREFQCRNHFGTTYWCYYYFH